MTYLLHTRAASAKSHSERMLGEGRGRWHTIESIILAQVRAYYMPGIKLQF